MRGPRGLLWLRATYDCLLDYYLSYTFCAISGCRFFFSNFKQEFWLQFSFFLSFFFFGLLVQFSFQIS